MPPKYVVEGLRSLLGDATVCHPHQDHSRNYMEGHTQLMRMLLLQVCGHCHHSLQVCMFEDIMLRHVEESIINKVYLDVILGADI